MYQAEIGRWLMADPLADAKPDMTPYRYSFNDPINITDPSGLIEERETKPVEYAKGAYGELIDASWVDGDGDRYNSQGERLFSVTTTRTDGTSSTATRTESQAREVASSAANANNMNQWLEGFQKKNEEIFGGGETQQGGSTDDLQDITKQFYGQLARTQVFYYNAKKEMDEKNASFEERLYFFKETIGHGKLFDIKQPGMGFHHTEIGLKSIFNGNVYDWDDYGNINFGLAAKTFGISLNWAKFGAGMQQVFGAGDGAIDWCNFDGFFDEYNDTKMIKMGYDMKLPWQK